MYLPIHTSSQLYNRNFVLIWFFFVFFFIIVFKNENIYCKNTMIPTLHILVTPVCYSRHFFTNVIFLIIYFNLI